jgi:hypothetical protein
MADEKNQNSGKSAQPVDIETMKVKLIIVCKEQSKLEPVATFLNRRGWEIQVTTKIKDALAAVSTVKPDFVLVSANHPNPKLMKFPTIMKSTFDIPCIGFAETSDTRAQSVLQNLPVQWRISGPLSGPTTQRRIKQILQEIYGSDAKSEKKAWTAGSETDDEIIMAKGGASKKQPSYVSIKGGGPSKKKRPSRIDENGNEVDSADGDGDEFSTDESSVENNTSRDLSDGGKTFVDKGRAPQEFGTHQADVAAKSAAIASEFGDDDFPQTSAAGETVMMPNVAAPKEVSLNADGTIFEEDFTLDAEAIADIVSGVKKELPSDNELSDESSLNEATPEARNEAATSTIAAMTAGELIAKDDSANASSSRGIAPWPHEAAAVATDRLVRKVFSKNPGKATFFEKLVIKILNELRVKRQAVENRVRIVERLVVISVQSPNTNGYLILSSTATNAGLREICMQVKTQLADFLRQEGKMFEFGTPAMVMCSAHDFLDETQALLEFAHVADYGDGELAIKFLSAPQAAPKLYKVEGAPRYRIDAKEVPLNRPVDFKFHIHLEKNQKFVALVKEGGVFTKKYQERLEQNGKGLFVEEAEVENFKRFFATAIALDLLKVESYRVEYAEPPPATKTKVA